MPGTGGLLAHSEKGGRRSVPHSDAGGGAGAAGAPLPSTPAAQRIPSGRSVPPRQAIALVTLRGLEEGPVRPKFERVSRPVIETWCDWFPGAREIVHEATEAGRRRGVNPLDDLALAALADRLFESVVLAAIGDTVAHAQHRRGRRGGPLPSTHDWLLAPGSARHPRPRHPRRNKLADGLQRQEDWSQGSSLAPTGRDWPRFDQWRQRGCCSVLVPALHRHGGQAVETSD